ncbi:MAG: hypothetical protein U1C46_00305 [Bacteroidales bacterium]|nr:hypothetical protein [Bacteroidales bacterium]
MNDTTPPVTIVHFDEHPFTDTSCGSIDAMDVTLHSSFTTQEYCNALFHKIFTIGLSEISGFLDYQCAQLKNPSRWLNALEKLIKENLELFLTRHHQHRHTKLISQIDIKRHSLQAVKPLLRKQHKKVNAFTDEKEYCFTTVREQSAQFETLEEKIAFLHGQIFDYRQHSPDFISLKEQPFDRLCELEIERLEKNEMLLQKATARKNADKKGKKLPYNGELKFLCDVFFKLMHKPTRNSKTILPWTITETTEYICSTLCEPDGSSINPVTVRTYLSASKPDSRPKTHTEINFD